MEKPSRPTESPAGPQPTTVAGEDPTARKLDDRLADSARVGRYVILEEVGVGGMGRVYRAYDPKLHREVALKLLRVRGPTSDGDDANARLLREAQAMAQLSHPNVLPVYDVEALGERVFIAMEYVEGETLRAWLASGTRGWQAVVRVFVAAGSGLAAAHRVGLVHRDFKPANVLIGKDGRVRVTDFGLAIAVDAAPDESRSTPTAAGTRTPGLETASGFSTHLTRSGLVMGTPAYMAPEQLTGAPADESCDQYSFCVALFEGLHGQRPFNAKNERELNQAKKRGDIETPPNGNTPRWLDRIVRRGLAPKPGDRFSSMDSLLTELGRNTDRVRRGRLIGGAAVIAAVSVGGLVILGTQRDETCAGANRKLDGVWDAERREAVAARFGAAALPYGDAVESRVAAIFDAYAQAWISGHTDACEATRVRREQSEDMLDRRMACLSRQRGELAALVELFARSDAAVVERAVQASSRLSPVSRCADPTFLLAEVEPPADHETARRVETLRGILAEVTALERTGKPTEGLARANELLQDSEQTEYRPLIAEVLYRRGRLQSDSGDYEAASQSLKRSYFLALRSGFDRQAAKAAGTLVFLNGTRQARYDDALEWSEHASALVEHAGLGAEHHAQLEHYVGVVLHGQGRHVAAANHLRRSIEIWGSVGNRDDLRVAAAINSLGIVAFDQGELEAASEAFRKALEIWTEELGPEHPSVASVLNELGGVLTAAGDHAGAVERHREALEIQTGALGPDHPSLGRSHGNIGNALSAAGSHADALTHYRKSMALSSAAYPRDHPGITGTVMNVGQSLLAIGQTDAALQHFQRGLAGFQRVLPPGHHHIGRAHGDIGSLLLSQGQLARAARHLERALKIFESSDVADPGAPRARFSLARALWDSGSDRKRAIAHAERARDEFRSAGERGAAQLAAVEAWLNER